MKIQRINDERLAIKNLKNARIGYTLQALGIIAILGYNFITNGIDGVINNPLWIVFVASTIVLAFMSFGKDERLTLRNLQITRIAYAIQVIGFVVILGYDYVAGGMDKVQENPIWILFTVTTGILIFLMMNISVEYENHNQSAKEGSAKKGLVISLIAVVLISTTIGVFTALTDGHTVTDGVITALVFIVCGSIPFYFLYTLRKKNDSDS